MEITELVTMPAAQVALIVGLAEVIKRIGLPSKWIPLIDVALGAILGAFVDGLLLGMGVPQGIIVGIILGLSACGLFSGVKSITGGYDEPSDDV